jgi:hypothetical protein
MINQKDKHFVIPITTMKYMSDALLWSVMANDLAEVKKLLNTGADSIYYGGVESGEGWSGKRVDKIIGSPIWIFAIKNSPVEIIKELFSSAKLTHGIDSEGYIRGGDNARGAPKDKTLQDTILRDDLQTFATENSRWDVLEYLIEQGKAAGEDMTYIRGDVVLSIMNQATVKCPSKTLAIVACQHLAKINESISGMCKRPLIFRNGCKTFCDIDLQVPLSKTQFDISRDDDGDVYNNFVDRMKNETILHEAYGILNSKNGDLFTSNNYEVLTQCKVDFYKSLSYVYGGDRANILQSAPKIFCYLLSAATEAIDIGRKKEIFLNGGIDAMRKSTNNYSKDYELIINNGIDMFEEKTMAELLRHECGIVSSAQGSKTKKSI